MKTNVSSRARVVAVVDERVDHIDELMSGFLTGVEVEVVAATEDPVRRISSLLQASEPAVALHVFAHGEPGSIRVGTGINLLTLADKAESFSSWTEHLLPSAEIVLYGCSSGADTHFISEFERVTKREVYAASTAVAAGNWPEARNARIPLNADTLAGYSGHFGDEQPFLPSAPNDEFYKGLTYGREYAGWRDYADYYFDQDFTATDGARWKIIGDYRVVDWSSTTDDILSRNQFISGRPSGDSLTGANQGDLIIGDAPLVLSPFTSRSIIPSQPTGADPVKVFFGAADAPAGSVLVETANPLSGFPAYGENDTINGAGGNDTIMGDGYVLGHEEVGVNPIIQGINAYSSSTIQTNWYWAWNFYGFGAWGGSDSLNGGSGNDIIVGDAEVIEDWSKGGEDTADGGIANDTIFGDAYVIRDYGAGYNDSLKGGSGNDIIYGDAFEIEALSIHFSGNILDGQALDYANPAGRDWIDGEVGNDTLIGDAYQSAYFNDDVIAGGDGHDVVVGDSYIVNAVTQDGTDPVGNSIIAQFNGGFRTNGGDDLIYGDRQTDGTAGTPGNDTITGDFHRYTTFDPRHLPGNDTIYAGSGDDRVFGDIRFYGESPSTELLNTGGDDQIYGELGNDSIEGQGGNDLLSGGQGSDTILGGYGNDTILPGTAGSSADFVSGGAGNDFLDFRDLANVAVVSKFSTVGTGTVEDRFPDFLLVGTVFNGIEGIIGSDVGDFLNGSSGVDTLIGWTGNDSIVGGNGNDVLIGDFAINAPAGEADTPGNDTIEGGSGKDIIWGDYQLNGGTSPTVGGTDIISGGTGSDTIYGGAGNDTIFGALDSPDWVSGGAGIDLIDYSASSAASGVNVHLDKANAAIGADTIIGVENAIGTIQDDTIMGGSGDNSIAGGRGNDLLSGGLGKDTLDGGDLFDTVDYSASSASVIVDLGSDVAPSGGDAEGDKLISIEGLIGSKGNDDLTGSGLGNVIRGGDGNDTIEGGLGSDTLAGEGGIDTLKYSKSAAGVSVSLAVGSTPTNGDANGDVISGFENLVGSNWNDVLVGSSGANQLEGLAGSDTMFGREGNDTIDGGLGRDTIDAGEGDDLVFGSLNNRDYSGNTGDSLKGGIGTDTISYEKNTQTGVSVDLRGQDSASSFGPDKLSGFENLTGTKFGDQLWGDSSANLLRGLGGNDRIEGFGGDDTLEGGSGNDTFFLSFLDLGRVDGGEGVDLADYSFDEQGGSLIVDLGLLGPQANGSTLVSIENVRGTLFDDRLIGNDMANVLEGKAGNDTLRGGGGADSLDGGAGFDLADYSDASALLNVDLATGVATGGGVGSGDTLTGIEGVIGSDFGDSLSGDSGANVLEGGKGDDTLNGGGGADTLVGQAGNDYFLGAAGNDTFDGGADRDAVDYIGLLGNISVNLALGTATGSGIGTDTLTSIEDAFTSVGDDTLIGSSSDNLLVGGVGNDILIGGDGNDTLKGGTGGDAFFGGNGVDSFDGGEGYDTVDYSLETSGITLTGEFVVSDGAPEFLIDVERLIGTDYEDIFSTLSAGPDPIRELFSGEGNDGFILGTGSFLANGGADDDTFRVHHIGHQIEGGSDFDTVDYSRLSTSEGLMISLEKGYSTSLSNPGLADFLTGIEAVRGTVFADEITGDANGNLLLGGDGDDALSGGGGADTLLGGYGDDTLAGGEGADTFRIETSDGAGSDLILDLDASDTIVIEGFESNGTPRSDNGSKTRLGQVDVSNDGVSTTIHIGLDSTRGADASFTLAGVYEASDFELKSDTLTLAREFEGIVFIGGPERDKFYGGTGNDTISGEGGDDALQGARGDDSLAGGEGNDFIAGGSGNDTIDGGPGSDVLRGDEGNDTFMFVKGDDSDRIRDLNLKEDTVVLKNFNSVGSFSDLDSNGDDVIDVEDVLVESFNKGIALNIEGQILSLEGLSVVDQDIFEFV